MAWVRPKHPKPRVVVDNTESRKNLLQYFSGQRARPSPSPPRIDRPAKLDPTLQHFAHKKQVAQAEKPAKYKPRETQTRYHPPQHQEPVAVVVDYDTEPDDFEEPLPIAPPPRKVFRKRQYGYASAASPKPDVPTRAHPKVAPRRSRMDWEGPERASWESRSMMSSRWASAITPLSGLR